MLSLTPYCRSTLWGGSRLLKVFSDANLPNLAEAWLVSLHAEGESLAGEETLSVALKNAGVDQKTCQSLPLIKFIDTDDLLSVQVHPNDQEAFLLDGEHQGKNEMWYILSATPDAFIYLNLKSTKDNFLAALSKNTPTEELVKVHVKEGDVFPIPAGMVHALGKGITLLEIQQQSNLTYRLWDFLRLDANGLPRPLHKEKAEAVLRPYTKEEIHAFRYDRGDQKSYEIADTEKPNLTSVANTPYFRVDILEVTPSSSVSLIADKTPLVAIGLNGEGEAASQDTALPLSFGKTLLLLPKDGKVTFKGNMRFALVSL